MYKSILDIVSNFDFNSITDSRKNELYELVDYLTQKLKQEDLVNVVFVCTHNSRRSQFTQVWAHIAANYYNLPIHSYSAGTEVTEANARTIASLERFGFKISKKGDINPFFKVSYGDLMKSIIIFSKDLSHSSLPKKNFAAIMTCSHADENCPFIPNCNARIPLRYEDPKAFDDSDFEKEKYDEKSLKIGTEIFYIFSLIVND